MNEISSKTTYNWIDFCNKLKEFKKGDSLRIEGGVPIIVHDQCEGEEISKRVVKVLLRCFRKQTSLEHVRLAIPALQHLKVYCHEIATKVERGIEKIKQIALATSNADAQYHLGVYFFKENDNEQAVDLFHSAATNGSVEAQFVLGNLYRKGVMVEKNQATAMQFYKMAAEQNNVHALYDLAKCYRKGKGVEIDNEMAFLAIQQAATLGHFESQIDLTVCYFSGTGVEKNLEIGIELLTQFAEMGNDLAQVNLAHCYARGDIVPKDLAKAASLFRLADSLGNPAANQHLQELSGYMQLWHANNV